MEERSPTPRELLDAYTRLWSLKLVAHDLRLSPDTVKNHLANVRAKVGASTTAEAIWRLRDRLG